MLVITRGTFTRMRTMPGIVRSAVSSNCNDGAIMGGHYNNLSPSEAERLAYLLEELGEAQQAIGKILRHGYESYDPTVAPPAPTNRTMLRKELVDVVGAISRMERANDFREGAVLAHADPAKGARYMHHQPGE